MSARSSIARSTATFAGAGLSRVVAPAALPASSALATASIGDSSWATSTSPACRPASASSTNSGSSAAFRQLGQTYTDGRLYFGYVMNYQYEGAGKYEGLSLFYGTAEEKLFVGEIGGADRQLGVFNAGV